MISINRLFPLQKITMKIFRLSLFLFLKELQKYIAVIYWFARTADDIADEGNLSEEERLKQLDNFKIILLKP